MNISLSNATIAMWSLDVDGIPHPHISLALTPNQTGPTIASPTDNSRSLSVCEDEDLLKRHDHYFFTDDSVVFQVEDTRYKIHRYFFQQYSEIFASIFALPGGPGQGSSDYNAIHLVGIQVRDFDLFLSILYPPKFGEYAAVTVSEWTSILDLSAKWKFESVRSLSIKQLALLASPIDKIILGRRHGITEWLRDAYRSVCERPETLTLEEANRLGMDDVVKISSLRQEALSGWKPPRPIKMSPMKLSKTFGLDGSSDGWKEVQEFPQYSNAGGLMPSRRDWEFEQPVDPNPFLADAQPTPPASSAAALGSEKKQERHVTVSIHKATVGDEMDSGGKEIAETDDDEKGKDEKAYNGGKSNGPRPARNKGRSVNKSRKVYR